MSFNLPMCSRHGRPCAHCPRALVMTAGLLSAHQSKEIGIVLSQKLGMRVFADDSFVKMLQDAWLQENADRAVLASLLESRGRGVTTPLYPMPTIIVLLKVAPEETRKNLLAKSCQTSEQSSQIPYRYIENLTNAYAQYASSFRSEVQLHSVCVNDLYAEYNTLKHSAAEALALGTMIAQKTSDGAGLGSVPEGSGDPVSPPTSPPAQTRSPRAQAHWERLENSAPVSF